MTTDLDILDKEFKTKSNLIDHIGMYRCIYFNIKNT